MLRLNSCIIPVLLSVELRKGQQDLCRLRHAKPPRMPVHRRDET